MSFARFLGLFGGGGTDEGRPCPDATLSVIGDVHGCDAALDALLARPEVAAGQLVFVGDLIDRGPGSKAVVDRVMSLSREGRATAIMGNHERMLLDFLDDPAGKGRRWLKYGGIETLQSYGVPEVAEKAPARRMIRTRDALAAAMGDDTVAWLAARPIVYRSGNLAVVHAGADPARGIDDQRPAALLWGHEDMGKTARADGIWIAHGHRIVDRPRAAGGIIAVDTGAYRTGRLSAALISPAGQVRLVSEGAA